MAPAASLLCLPMLQWAKMVEVSAARLAAARPAAGKLVMERAMVATAGAAIGATATVGAARVAAARAAIGAPATVGAARAQTA